MYEPVHAASNATLNSTELNKFTTRTQNPYVRTTDEQDYVKSEAVYITRSHPFAPSPKTSILHSTHDRPSSLLQNCLAPNLHDIYFSRPQIFVTTHDMEFAWKVVRSVGNALPSKEPRSPKTSQPANKRRCKKCGLSTRCSDSSQGPFCWFHQDRGSSDDDEGSTVDAGYPGPSDPGHEPAS